MAEGQRVRKSFGKVPAILSIPNLIEIQRRSFDRFLQENVPSSKKDDMGLQAAFQRERFV